MALERDLLNYPLRNGLDVNRLIQMNLALEEKQRNIRRPLTLLTVINVLFAIARTTNEISLKLAKLKQLGVIVLECFDLLSLVEHPVLYLTVAAVALDLTADNIKDIKVMCIMKKIRCTNERSRCEIQQLLQLLEHRPLCFTDTKLLSF